MDYAPYLAVLLAWAAATIALVRPTVRYLSRLAGRDPTLMCAGCRARRRWFVRSILPPALYATLNVLEWPWRPLVPWMRRVAGTEPQPRCVGPSCAAHARYNAHASEESP